MERRNLHDLPHLEDRWSHLYLEHGRIDKDSNSLLFTDVDGETRVPVDQLLLVLLGPGTRVTHNAMKLLADNNCLVCWVGEHGVRVYAASTGGTHSARRLLRQAELWADDVERMRVVRRMYAMRFPGPIDPSMNIEALRAMEGGRVRQYYQEQASRFRVEWNGRCYDQDDWRAADPLNRALSASHACLYGICHAAILSAGYSPAIGFIHTGKQLSFVYDIADLYKAEITIPVSFAAVAEGPDDVERRVRITCRDIFHQSRLLKRVIPDIGALLDVGDDGGVCSDELEGRAVSMADRAAQRRILGEP